MNKAEQLRELADNCTQLAEDAKDEPSRSRFARLEKSYLSLAEMDDWLEGAVNHARVDDARDDKRIAAR